MCQSAESGLQSLILFSLEQTQTNKLEQEKCFYREYAALLGQADLNQKVFFLIIIFPIQRESPWNVGPFSWFWQLLGKAFSNDSVGWNSPPCCPLELHAPHNIGYPAINGPTVIMSFYACFLALNHLLRTWKSLTLMLPVVSCLLLSYLAGKHYRLHSFLQVIRFCWYSDKQVQKIRNMKSVGFKIASKESWFSRMALNMPCWKALFSKDD